MATENSFNEMERATLHSLAEMFSAKDDRDQLRRLVHEGATLREIVMAYRTQRRMIATLKALGSLIVLAGAVAAAIKGLSHWPK